MLDPRKPVFDAIDAARDKDGFDQMEVGAVDNLLDALGVGRAEAAPFAGAACREVTPRIALELLAHEGLVREAYRDSVGVWTWSVGITDASGHRVARYRDNPQPVERCLEVYLWLLETRYLPDVLRAFERGKHEPSEAELGAALSFHYNTGAIGRADWIRLACAGDHGQARVSIMNWSKPAEIIPRRRRERDLFFDDKWSGDGTVLIYHGVSRPSYRPTNPARTDVRAAVERLLG